MIAVAANPVQSVSILPVNSAIVFDAPNAENMLRAYATECLEPDGQPQREMYESLERMGALQCFAAYDGLALVGFISVLVSLMPHTGKKLAAVESVFVDPEYRDGGAGTLLLDTARRYAQSVGCTKLTWVVRLGSRLDRILSRRAGCSLTHHQYTENLVLGGAA